MGLGIVAVRLQPHDEGAAVRAVRVNDVMGRSHPAHAGLGAADAIVGGVAALVVGARNRGGGPFV